MSVNWRRFTPPFWVGNSNLGKDGYFHRFRLKPYNYAGYNAWVSFKSLTQTNSLRQRTTMIRTLCLSLIAALAFCAQTNADFLIDDFVTLDVANDAATQLVYSAGGGDIFVEVSSTGGTVITNGSGYTATAFTTGDTFTVSYTWSTPTFDDLQGTSGLELASIPQGFAPDWNLDISLDGVTNAYSGSAIGAPGGSIALDTATELTFSYTWTAATTPVFGASGFFGSVGSAPLFATPEPTTFAMLGSVAVLGLVRRRRR